MNKIYRLLETILVAIVVASLATAVLCGAILVVLATIMCLITLFVPVFMPWYLWLGSIPFLMVFVRFSWKGFSWLTGHFVSPFGLPEGVGVLEPWY